MTESTPITLVVVEDNELDLEKIMRAYKRLETANRLVHFDNGIDALAALRGDGPGEKLAPTCVVVLDLNLPKITGFEFLSELRCDRRISKTPVLVLTTSERSTDVQKAYDFNVAGYLVKPIDINQMYETFKTLNEYWSINQLPPGDHKGRLTRDL